MLIKGMTAQEIRVLQEFRRISTDTLPLAELKALKHPVGGGEAPVLSLVEKGYLVADEGRENFTLTERGREFLALEVAPAPEAGTAAPEPEA